MTKQQKLKRFWETIKYSHPLLAGLIDIGDDTPTDMKRLDKTELNTETIMKKLGTVINFELNKKGETYYFHLFITGASIWTKMCSSENDPNAFDPATKPDETNLGETTTTNGDDFTKLSRNTFPREKWANQLFSIIASAFKFFQPTPCYSKETCVLPSRSSAFEYNGGIKRGDILCVRRYVNIIKPIDCISYSYYHYGVYVGRLETTDDGEYNDAVIHLEQDSVIRVSHLSSDGKNKRFVHENRESKYPPLLFKLVYENQTQEQLEKTAKTAENIYRDPSPYKGKFSLLWNNCEHFVNICAFGTPYCEQLVKFTMNTIFVVFKTIVKGSRCIIPIAFEGTEVIARNLHSLGESANLVILVVECAVQIFWDLFSLSKSKPLTHADVVYTLKKRLAPIAPELLSAIIFLVISICFGCPGIFLSITFGVANIIISLALRFIARPRIQRYIEDRELARREDFSQWKPREVAKLVMKTTEEDKHNAYLLHKFESGKLSGEAVTRMVEKRRQESSDEPFKTAFDFLSPEEFKVFEEKLAKILGHLSLKDFQNSIVVEYEGKSFAVPLDVLKSSTTAGELLNIARCNWGIDFAKKKWQLESVGTKDGIPTIHASWALCDGLKKEIYADFDGNLKLKLSYDKSDGCTLI